MLTLTCAVPYCTHKSCPYPLSLSLSLPTTALCFIFILFRSFPVKSYTVLLSDNPSSLLKIFYQSMLILDPLTSLCYPTITFFTFHYSKHDFSRTGDDEDEHFFILIHVCSLTAQICPTCVVTISNGTTTVTTTALTSFQSYSYCTSYLPCLRYGTCINCSFLMNCGSFKS